MVKKLIYWPDKRLVQPVVKASLDDNLESLAGDLVDSMVTWGGIGLAAPQIGVSLAAFSISQELDHTEIIEFEGDCVLQNAWVFFNPEFTWLGPDTEVSVEGCLSFPDIFLQVKRHLECEMEAINFQGQPARIKARGLLARALQHERDHLAGKTMMSQFGSLKREIITKKMRKWKRKHER